MEKYIYDFLSREDYQEFLRKNKLTKKNYIKAVNQQFKGFEVYFQSIIDMKTERFIVWKHCLDLNVMNLVKFHH